LAQVQIQGLSLDSAEHTTELIWKVIWNLQVGIGSTKIVSGSKAENSRRTAWRGRMKGSDRVRGVYQGCIKEVMEILVEGC